MIGQMKENPFFKFLIETDLLDTRSYFPPANQNVRLTTHSCDVTAVFPYSHLNTAIDQWECAYYPNYFIIDKRCRTVNALHVCFL